MKTFVYSRMMKAHGEFGKPMGRYSLALVLGLCVLFMPSLVAGQPRLGVQAGAGLSHYKIKTYYGSLLGESRTSYFAGIFFDYVVPLGVGKLEPEIAVNLQKLGGEHSVGYTSGAGAFDIEERYDPFYLSIPIVLHYTFDIGPVVLFAGAGPQLNVGLFGTKATERFGVGRMKNRKKIVWGEPSQLVRFNMDVRIKAGAIFMDRVRVGLCFDIGVMSMIHKSNLDYIEYHDNWMYNRNIGFEIAYIIL